MPAILSGLHRICPNLISRRDIIKEGVGCLRRGFVPRKWPGPAQVESFLSPQCTEEKRREEGIGTSVGSAVLFKEIYT